MNKMNLFFSEILQQIHKMYEKVSIITSLWNRATYYFTSMSNAWYLITVPNTDKITKFFSLRYITTVKNFENMSIIIQIWHRAKFYFICISGPWYLVMVPIWRKSIQASWRNAWGLTDRRTDRLDLFLYSLILLRRSRE